MRKPMALLAAAICIAAPPTYAGVAMEMVTKNAAGRETERTKIFAQSQRIRMDGGNAVSGNSMIFLGDEFLVLDHKDKTYIVMDEAMLSEVSSQISKAMKQMEKQLAGLPPEQRAMAEQMMKGRMAGMMGAQDAPPGPRVEEIGNGQWNAYSCKNYAVYLGATKSQEVCAAALSDLDGADEMLAAFRGMAAFVAKLTESLPFGSDTLLNPGELMDQIEGFPVHTVNYKNGTVAHETSLESLTEQPIDEQLFAVPDGYRQQDPFSGR
ncbi:MAG: DUF4412 domain-containing protein [Gammaproteobacteria bacterium]|nr:DUF4412 domain-containing protein [Gammaproteobacteria bacterium]